MPDEVHADPIELAKAAREALTESQTLFTDLADQRGRMALDGPTFVQDGSYNALHSWDNSVLLGYASTAIERIVTVLEEEADGLYHTAFAFQAADEESGRQVGGTAGPNYPI